MRDFFFALTRNGVSRAGTALATASGVVFMVLAGLELAGARTHPYLGILTYLILPTLLVAGLLLIPVGLARERRRARRDAAAGGPPSGLVVLDLNAGRTRRILLSFILLTGVNLAVIGTATHKTTEVMDSTRFCGTTCHTVMAPEYAGHQRSVHAGVKCVACHIGPGGTWYVRAKVSGARQAVEAMLGTYARPIPAPVPQLRSANETCTECHQPARDVGETRRAIRERADDETSTPQETVLMMKVGGRHGDVVAGIHWHADPSVAIRYHSDPKREVIDTIEVRQAGHEPETYRTKTPPPADSGAGSARGPGEGGWRVMDCVDCHNRAAHPSSTPEREVDEAIDRGRIDATLPFVRREAVRLLKEACSTHDAQRGDCTTGLRAFYAGKYPDLAESRGGAITAAGAAIDELGARSLFPAMAVTWDTYPSHLGHMNSPGCFRCHDGEHVSAAGKSIPQDCDTCHAEPASS